MIHPYTGQIFSIFNNTLKLHTQPFCHIFTFYIFYITKNIYLIIRQIFKSILQQCFTRFCYYPISLFILIQPITNIYFIIFRFVQIDNTNNFSFIFNNKIFNKIKLFIKSCIFYIIFSILNSIFIFWYPTKSFS